MSRLIIAGGGLAGCLAAIALAKRTDLDLLLLEQAPSFGGNHTWSFFDSDVEADQRWLLDPLIEWKWPEHEVHFPRRSRTIAIGYNSLRSHALSSAIISTLRPEQYRLGAAITQADATSVVLASGERLEADAVIDARGGGMAFEGLELAWQKFVGRIYEFPAGHRVARPIIMDATVEQVDGYRFLYFLPLSRSRLLIEDTYYAMSSNLDTPQLESRLDRAASRLCRGRFETIEQENGVLPVILDGDFDRFWPPGDTLPRLGVRGGFFHPTTSYSLSDAVANALLLAEQKEFRPGVLQPLLRQRAERKWNDGAFYRLLNRMLFHAAEPNRAYRVLEHFYRLPKEVVARFYAGRLTSLDKLRIVSGKPPVPIGRALRAMRRTAA